MNIVQKSNGRYFLVDEKDNELSSGYKTLEQIKDFPIAIASRDSINGTVSVVDDKGKRITEWLLTIGEFNKYGLSKIEREPSETGDDYALMDKFGNKATGWYYQISEFNKLGLALIENYKRAENQCTYVNSKGEIVSDWFDYVKEDFNEEGFAIVTKYKSSASQNINTIVNSEGKRITDYYNQLLFVDYYTVKVIKEKKAGEYLYFTIDLKTNVITEIDLAKYSSLKVLDRKVKVADFKVSGGMKVKYVIERFKESFSTGIRIYSGQIFANPDATIASLRNGKTEIRGAKDIAISSNMLVKEIEDLIQEKLGVKVQIEDAKGGLADDNVTIGSLVK